MQSLLTIQTLSLILMLGGIGLAFSNIRVSGWILGWILLSGALLLQGFRSVLSYFAARGGVDANLYATANEWMGLGFALLVVASMLSMREVFAHHQMATEVLHMVGATANDAIIVVDNGGRVVVWNRAAHRIFGYSKEEAQGKALQDLVIAESKRAEFATMFIQFGEDGRESVSNTPTELACMRKDGTAIVTEYSMSRAIVDGKWNAIIIIRDITARKQAEELTRGRTAALASLSARMLSSDEMEKKKLAFGLHESLAQKLVTIKMHAERKLSRMAATGERDESVAAIISLLQSAIEEIETTATGLRPSSLDELGLLPTIDWFCRNFDRRHPAIQVDAELSVQEDEVPAPLKVVIYRIIESALTNIARYENTDRIEIALRRDEGSIALTIDDTSTDPRYASPAERTTDSDLQVPFSEAQERTILSGGSFAIARGKAGGIALRALWAV